jgi:PqqD family protein of HPr-rel-A system
MVWQTAVIWQVHPGQRLQHRLWDDEYVVFNDLSGDTHLLDASAMDVLLSLNAGPMQADQLNALLGCESALDQEERDAIAHTLARLQALHLITSTPC